ncbi:MAG: flagellar biosynthesis protein FliP [Actinomycetota bacterium]|nr:flagellar biosynthesis protein FliP [Actinomycetota bacterium]
MSGAGRPIRAGLVALAACVVVLGGAPSASADPPAGGETSPTATVSATVAAATTADAAAPAVRLAATQPVGPTRPGAPAPTGTGSPAITVDVPGEPSKVIGLIVLITVLGVAPSLLLMCTAFTKIIVVLSLTRSAIGTQTVPPNQVLVGLALFLSLFIMGPTVDAMQAKGITPYLGGTKNAQRAYTDASVPLREFMLNHTRDEDLALMIKAAGRPLPKDREVTDLRTLIPAFVLSELRGAFIIGFVIFVPFLVVDLVVSAILMSLGMVMLPPSLISLPFKLLLFVLVDGWSLIVTTLLGGYR